MNTHRSRRWAIVVGVALTASTAGWLFGRLPSRPSPARQKTRQQDSLPPQPAAASDDSKAREAQTQPEGDFETRKGELLEVARRLVERFPNSPDSFAVVARAQFWLGNSTAAEEACRKCLELDPGFAAAYQALGMIAANKGDYEKAAAMFRKSSSLDPQLAQAAGFLADALINLGEAEEAAEVLEENIQRHPGVPANYFLLGQARLQMQQFDMARQSFEKTVALLPTYTQAYYGLAAACTRLGRPDQARQYRERFEVLKAKDQEIKRDRLRPTEEAANLQENLAPIYRAAAEAYQRHGELGESERLRRKAELLSPAEAGQ